MSDNSMLQEEQFVISYELLHVLEWLLKHQEAELSQIIAQAIIKGYEEKLQKQHLSDQIQNSDDVTQSIVKFFNFLEQNMAMMNHLEHDAKITHVNILKALDQIDPETLDYDTIKSTVLATAEKIKPKNNDEAKSLFFKELLKQWNPKKEKNKELILEH
ncbi:hypothetical protein KAZ82_01155 [Candidatus Babeliales bacterium]|nr:hypothetical protein [Candidatus Babeliales bacterium]